MSSVEFGPKHQDIITVVSPPRINWYHRWQSFYFPIQQGHEAVNKHIELSKMSGLEIAEKSLLEQCTVFNALSKMGINFIYTDSKKRFLKLRKDLRQLENKSAYYKHLLPTQIFGFPRDIATVLPNGKVLLNDLIGQEAEKDGFERNYFGEGGRVIIRKNVALINDVVFHNHNLCCNFYETLENEGLEILAIPPALIGNYEFKSGNWEQENTSIVDHVDTTSVLLESPNGKLHLILSNWLSKRYDPDDYPDINPYKI